MHAIYISKFVLVFFFFTMKSLLPLERYPLRRRLHHVKFNYSAFFFFEDLWLLSHAEPLNCCSVVYCDFDDPPPHFSIIAF